MNQYSNGLFWLISVSEQFKPEKSIYILVLHLQCSTVKTELFKNNMKVTKERRNKDEAILLNNMSHRLYPEITKILVRGIFGNENSTSLYGF